jgi:uncharacterized membrane protein YfcA
MTPAEFTLLGITGLLTAALTAMIGFGGGAILIGVMLLFMPPAVVIPLHGVVQVFANSWRVFLFRHYIGWHLVWRFVLLMPLGILVGLWFFQGLSKEAIQVFIGSVVLVSLFARRLKRFRDKDLPLGAFIPLGFLGGILNIMVGVVGPLMGVLVVRRELKKEQVIGTLGFFGLIGHVLKVGAFGLVGFRFMEHLPALAVLLPSVVLGVALGKWLLGHFNERIFMIVFQGLLVVLSFKLIVMEGLLKLF